MGVNPEESSAPELTKKQELNNHKVLMRKWIRQAKVHVVHKLDREIKRLRERKGDEKTKEKCHRKADRLCKEVLAIKDLEADDVAIKALMNDRPLNEVLTDLEATPEERACSRLIHHGAVQTEVQKYRGANPHWKLQIPVLLERSKQKEKIAEKKRQEKLKRKPRLQKRPQDVNELKPNKEKGEDDNSSSDESSEKAPDEILDVPSSAESVQEAADENSSAPNEKQSSPLSSTATVSKQKQKQPAAGKKSVKKSTLPAKTAESFKPESKPLELDKVQGTIKVQVIKDWSDFEKSLAPSSAAAASEPSEDKVDLTSGSEKKKPRSSFFLGGEDEPQPEPPVEDEPRRIVPKISRNSRPGPVRPWRMNLDPAESEPALPRTKHPKAPRYFDKPASKSFTDSSRREPSVISPKPSAPAEKLHPSWEAKKRQSIATASFQGKKIKFDD